CQEKNDTRVKKRSTTVSPRTGRGDDAGDEIRNARSIASSPLACREVSRGGIAVKKSIRASCQCCQLRIPSRSVIRHGLSLAARLHVAACAAAKLRPTPETRYSRNSWTNLFRL